MAEPRAIVPEKGVRPVLNGTGSDFAKLIAVTIDSTGGDDPPNAILPSAGEKIYGVLISSSVRVDVTPDIGLADGRIGDVQVEGRVPCLVGTGGVTIDDDLAVDAAGAVVAAASGNVVVGKCMVTAVATDFTEVELSGASQSVILP